MFPRRRIILAVMAVFLLALLALWISREPSYQGRSLSEWLAEARPVREPPNASPGRAPGEEAARAIRGIGPKAVPGLVRMLNATEATDFGELQRQLRNRWALPGKHIPSSWELRRRGFVGLQILGPAAAPGLPDILRLIESDPGRIELWFLVEAMGPRSASAAPLLARTFPGLYNPDFEQPDPDFHPAWVASGLRMNWGGEHRQVLADQLTNKTNALITRTSCLWSLRKDEEFARGLIPGMVAIISDPAEPALLKRAALHALGRIPNADVPSLNRAIEQFESQFAPLPVGTIANGDFTQTQWSGTSEPPNDPVAPSALYRHWLTWNGVVGRNLTAGWPGLKIELAPRVPPGSISQAFRTTPGWRYELRFEAAGGRNLNARVHAGDLDEIYIPDSGDPAKPSQLSFQFRALSSLTTLTFSALEYESYGPFLDNIVVTPVAATERP